MQSFLTIDDLESVSQETLELMNARQEIHQRLEQYCARLENLKREFDEKDQLKGDTQAQATYEQLTTAIRHYRVQIKTDLPELSRRVVESRQLLTENGESPTDIDFIKQAIEERREEQSHLEYEAQMSKQQAERLMQERHEATEQLIDRIQGQTHYYDASYLAMDVYHYREDLKGVDRLDEVVEILYKRIQELSEKPVKIHGSAIQKLKIMDAHARKLWAQLQPEPRPIVEKKPKSEFVKENSCYTSVRGKVVVFGGHPSTRTYVKEKLPKLQFVWSTVEDGLRITEQAVQQIQTADLVLLLTDDTSHTVTGKAMTELQRLKKQASQFPKEVIELHHEGVSAIVEKLAWKLMFKAC